MKYQRFSLIGMFASFPILHTNYSSISNLTNCSVQFKCGSCANLVNVSFGRVAGGGGGFPLRQSNFY